MAHQRSRGRPPHDSWMDFSHESAAGDGSLSGSLEVKSEETSYGYQQGDTRRADLGSRHERTIIGRAAGIAGACEEHTARPKDGMASHRCGADDAGTTLYGLRRAARGVRG